jgi:hypothetical protein
VIDVDLLVVLFKFIVEVGIRFPLLPTTRGMPNKPISLLWFEESALELDNFGPAHFGVEALE